jgi:hypothetical protein
MGREAVGPSLLVSDRLKYRQRNRETTVDRAPPPTGYVRGEKPVSVRDRVALPPVVIGGPVEAISLGAGHEDDA